MFGCLGVRAVPLTRVNNFKECIWMHIAHLFGSKSSIWTLVITCRLQLLKTFTYRPSSNPISSLVVSETESKLEN